MKKFFSILVLSIAALTTTFAAKPKVIDKYVSIRPFSEIEIKGSTRVLFTQGDTTSVVVHGLEEAVENVIVEHSNNTLIISQKGTQVNSFSDLFNAFRKQTLDETLVVYVTSPDLTEIRLTGSGDFKVKGSLDTDNLIIRLTGSGDIDFNSIVCDNLKAELQGSGDIDIKFLESVTSTFNLRGSGDIDVKQHKVRRTDIDLLGSGDVEVYCSRCDEVNASIKGSGDIKLSGDIKTLNRSVKGSGDIIMK